MNASHKKIVNDMQTGAAPAVNTVSTSEGEALIASGHARRATIDPAPPKGKMAINLTAKGRGVPLTAAAEERAPTPPTGTAPTTN